MARVFSTTWSLLRGARLGSPTSSRTQEHTQTGAAQRLCGPGCGGQATLTTCGFRAEASASSRRCSAQPSARSMR